MDNSGLVMGNTKGRYKISRLTNARYYATVHHRDSFQPKCFRLIDTQAGQITQPQACAFLNGVDWMLSILTGGLCRLTRGWSAERNRTPLAPVGLRKVADLLTLILCNSLWDFGWSGRPSWERGGTSQNLY
ncbi:hypothetical protein AVEN_121871-1 [Araneus ventricosus]|uniref:Uncharacterized protein n=1 Tax=Araneus ventricosus TaxID=182803 RepID=A0A4Y2TR30_ARAVE|nr:hypothetical protein AVEN_121871-1 [Araneus ventricosus]